MKPRLYEYFIDENCFSSDYHGHLAQIRDLTVDLTGHQSSHQDDSSRQLREIRDTKQYSAVFLGSLPYLRGTFHVHWRLSNPVCILL